MASKPMHFADWVKQAASTDKARPALSGVHVTARYMEATDGYRLHRWYDAQGYEAGVWDVRTGAAIDARYPNTDCIVPDFEPTFEIADVNEFGAVVAAALAYRRAQDRYATYLGAVTFSTQDGSTTALQSTWLSDVMRGRLASDSKPMLVMARTATSPIIFDVGNGLQAVLMTVGGAKPSRFDVSELTHPVSTGNETAQIVPLRKSATG